MYCEVSDLGWTCFRPQTPVPTSPRHGLRASLEQRLGVREGHSPSSPTSCPLTAALPAQDAWTPRGPVVPPARPLWAQGQTLEVDSFLQARPRALLFLLASPWPRDPGKLSLLPGLCFPVCQMGRLSTKARPSPQGSPWRRDSGKKGSLTNPMTLVKSPRCPVPAKMKLGVS